MSIEQPLRVRIQNDGGPEYATTITDISTGQQLQNVQRIDIAPIAVENRPIKVLLTTSMSTIDIIANAEIAQRCPCCGRLTSEH